MYKSFLSVLAVLILTLSCGGQYKDASGEISDADTLCVDSAAYIDAEEDTLELFDKEVLPESADELFSDFFYNYASDEDFRKIRTRRNGGYESGDSAVSEIRDLAVRDFYSVIYEREEEMTFQKDTSLSEVVVERINLGTGVVESFSFCRFDGKWLMRNVSVESIEDTPNSGFLSFYMAYSSDSVERMKCVADPLKLVLSTDDDDEADEEMELSLDEWGELSGDMPFPAGEIININYGQTCISNNYKILLVEGFSNGLYLKYKFMRKQGAWMLVEVEA